MLPKIEDRSSRFKKKIGSDMSEDFVCKVIVEEDDVNVVIRRSQSFTQQASPPEDRKGIEKIRLAAALRRETKSSKRINNHLDSELLSAAVSTATTTTTTTTTTTMTTTTNNAFCLSSSLSSSPENNKDKTISRVLAQSVKRKTAMLMQDCQQQKQVGLAIKDFTYAIT